MKTEIFYEWNDISLKTVFGYSATRRTSYQSWFLACQVLPPVLILQHQTSSSSSSPTTSSSEMNSTGESSLNIFVPRAEHFGDLITADHKVLSDNCEPRNNHRKAIVVQDLATQWIQSYPCKTKTYQETQRSFQKFLEPNRKPKVIYTDNSLEFGKACEDLSWNHCTSTPHRSETNGIAERAVRRVKEGTSAVLLQSGLDESWWADSMECYTCLRNVQDLLSDGKTPFDRRFGKPCKVPIIPFGSLVEYYPISAKDQSIHQRKSYLDCSSDTLCTRGEFGTVT